MTTQTKKPADLIRMPNERALQLKALSDALGGATMSATIGQLLEWAREQNKIAHGIPGINVHVFGDGIAIQFEGEKAIGFTPDQADQLVKTLRSLKGNSKAAGINADCNFYIDRRGPNGVKIAIPLSAEPKMLSMDLALEFADLIDRFLTDAPEADTTA